MTRRRSAILGVLVLGFGAAGMTGACGPSGSSESGCPAPDPIPTDMATECPAPMEEPCMRYRIPLVGNPSTDMALRNKYIAAFGTACYMSEANTFDCFYKEWKAACADAAKIGEVSGNAPYDQGYTCQPVGNEDYTLQVGPDIANKITINYQAAPRQTPLIDVDGVPTEVNGPYRNLGSSAKCGLRNFNDLDPSVLDVGVGGAVLAGGKGFADVASLRRGLRPPCLRLRSSPVGPPRRAAGQPGASGGSVLTQV